MNTTELSREFQSAVNLSHLIWGSISCAFNLIVCLLIILDSDPRGKTYRKYLFALQFFSTIADACMSAYAPFVLVNCRVIFANSELSKLVNLVTAIAIYSVVLTAITASYFLCVYFRRNMCLSQESRFCFHGHSYKIFIMICLLVTVSVQCDFCYTISTFNVSDEKLPSTMFWVKQTNEHVYLHETFFGINNLSGLYIFLCSTITVVSLIAMIIQLILEIKNGMKATSTATERYQTRAVYSILLQGVVPSIFLLAPIFILLVIYLDALVVGEQGALFNLSASKISVLAINLSCFHAFAHSLTVLACSPSYRKNLFDRMRNITSGTRGVSVTTVAVSKRRDMSAFTVVK